MSEQETTQENEAQQQGFVPQPQKTQATTKISNVFKWLALLSEWFGYFGTLKEKHFPNETIN